MAFDIYIGPPKSGKSYVAVHWLLFKWLSESTRPIYHNLPLTEKYWTWLFRSPALRSAAEQRCHLLEDQVSEAFMWRWEEAYWVKPDGLEVEPDCYPRNRDKALSRGWRELTRTLPDPVGAEGQAAYARRGAYMAKVSLGLKHQLREWWFFVPPGSAVVIDEAGEIWSTADRNKRPDELMSVINRHAHFKWDFQMLCHSLNDIDPVLRRKANYVFFVTNSTKEPMFPGLYLMRGLVWPFMFFRVRQYLGLDVVAKQPGREVQELDCWNIWPKKRCFDNYKSFTHSASLPWLRPAADDVKTADFQPSGWKRIAAGWKSYKRAVIFGLVLMIGWFGFVAGLRKILSMANTGTAASWLGNEQPTNSVTATIAGGAKLSPSGTNSAPVAPVAKADRVLWCSSTGFRTQKGFYGIGSQIGSNRVARVLLDGVQWSDGRTCRFDNLVF